MHTLSSYRRSGSELRAFLLFYGASTACAIVLHAIAASLTPSRLLTEYNAFAWTLSFLIGCSFCAWAFERQRKLAGH